MWFSLKRVRNREPEVTESKEKWQRTKSYWDLLQAQTDKEREVMETERQRQRVSNRDRWREQPPMWFLLLTLLPAAARLLPSTTHDHITTCVPTIGFVVSTPHLLLFCYATTTASHLWFKSLEIFWEYPDLYIIYSYIMAGCEDWYKLSKFYLLNLWRLF